MPIYTKKGDKGETGLYSSDKNKKIRVSKDSSRVEAIGAIDEANSYIGLALSFCEFPEIEKFLRPVQKDLFTIGSILAGSDLSFSASKVKKLEKKIDEIDEEIPKLQNFILVSGSKFATHIQYSRTLTRRAERRLVKLSKSEKIPPNILKFLNRLSDCLFTISRYINYRYGIEEEIWVGKVLK